jgi:hypothetical protein
MKNKPQPTPPTTSEDSYPSCETTVWQLGQWRCEYWRPEGTWRGGSLRLFRGTRQVRIVPFGLVAKEQSQAWQAAVRARPENDPR